MEFHREILITYKCQDKWSSKTKEVPIMKFPQTHIFIVLFVCSVVAAATTIIIFVIYVLIFGKDSGNFHV